MTAETPIACTLGAGDYQARISWVETINRMSLRRHERDGGTLRLFYDPAARPELEKLVEQERACCSFLDFQIAEADGDLVLAIRASERAGLSGEAIFAAFARASSMAQAPACGC